MTALQFFAASDDGPARLDILAPIGGPEWAGGVTVAAVRDALSGLRADEAVLVRINSPGGFSDDGVAIHSLLRSHGGEVSVDILGGAHSAAGVIAMAADPGRLRISEGGGMLIHDAWGFAVGNASDMTAAAMMLETTSEGIASILARRTGLERSEVREIMRAETLLGAEDAIAQGFADSLLETDEPVVETTVLAFRAWKERIQAGASQQFMAARSSAPITETSMPTIPLATLALALASTSTTEDELLGEVRGLLLRPTAEALDDVCAQRDGLLEQVAVLEADEEDRLLRRWITECRFDPIEALGEEGAGDSLARRFLRSAPGDSLTERVAFVEKVRPIRADIARMTEGGADTQEHREQIIPDPEDSRRRIEARAQEIAGDGKVVQLHHYRQATNEAASTDPEVTRDLRRSLEA